MVLFSNVFNISLWSITWTSEDNSLVKCQFQCCMTMPLNIKIKKGEQTIGGLVKELAYNHSEMKFIRRKFGNHKQALSGKALIRRMNYH